MAEIHDHASEHSDDVVAAIGPEQEALVAINAYMDAWNQRDLNEMDAAFHFPQDCQRSHSHHGGAHISLTGVLRALH